MRKIYMMLAAALVVLAANSCNKDNISDAPAQDSMVVKFTANVAGTKAVFNPSSFEGGAAVPVVPGDFGRGGGAVPCAARADPAAVLRQHRRRRHAKRDHVFYDHGAVVSVSGAV